MKKNIAKRWVKALRSGKYKQTKYILNNGNGEFCCLGVLCEIAAKDGVIKPRKKGNRVYYGRQFNVLPATVMKWAGVKDAEGLVYSPAVESLTYLNDDENYDFNQIADVIEEKYKHL